MRWLRMSNPTAKSAVAMVTRTERRNATDDIGEATLPSGRAFMATSEEHRAGAGPF